MELRDIYDLWDRFEQSSATTMELKMPGVKLYLDKSNHGPVVGETTSNCVKENINKGAVPKAAVAETKAAEEATGEEIKAPFVGTFYKAPTPEADAYVVEGQKVSKGDVLGIIEAMKMMNEITAPKDGVITKVLVDDQDMVAFDQPLFLLGEAHV